MTPQSSSVTHQSQNTVSLDLAFKVLSLERDLPLWSNIRGCNEVSIPSYNLSMCREKCLKYTEVFRSESQADVEVVIVKVVIAFVK